MKYEQLEEEHAIQLLMGNIDDKMTPYLCMASITTFQELLDRVAKFEKLNLSRSDGQLDKSKRARAYMKRGETHFTSFRKDTGKRLVYNIDKGKLPVYQEGPKQPLNLAPQPKLILGGNDVPRGRFGESERPKQSKGTNDPMIPTLKEKLNKEYSFKRKSVAKLFKHALKVGLQLPECKRPEEAGRTDDPNYCPYHRVISHPIEDCYIFKDWLERKYRNGEFTLSDSVLVRLRKESAKVISSSPAPSSKDKGKKKLVDEEEWQVAVSQKTVKMLKQVEGVPDIQ